MPVCYKRKLAFCHIPRTGGVSICLGLDLEIIDKHEPASFYRKHFPSYHLFATYRPYRERIESGINRTIPERRNWKGTYEELVDNILISKNNGIVLKPNEYFLDVPVDTLLQFNNPENDLNKMLRSLGEKSIELPHEDHLYDKSDNIQQK